MSDDRRQNQQQNQGPRATDLRFEPIKVRSLEFAHESVISGLKSVDGRTLVAGQHPRLAYLHVEIWFEPWQRMYRIREINTEPGNKVIKERCVPETWACYEPAVIG